MATAPILCLVCQANLGSCDPSWLNGGGYFSSVGVGLSTGVPLMYVSPPTMAAPVCPNCLGVINSYNLYGSLSGTDVSYDNNQISIAINAVLAINSLTLPPTPPILTREQTSPINIPGSEVKNAWW